jgi:uncharacterized membrane protein
MNGAVRLLAVVAALLLAPPGAALAQDPLEAPFEGAQGTLDDAPPGATPAPDDAAADDPAEPAEPAEATAPAAPAEPAAASDPPLPTTGLDAPWVAYGGLVALLAGVGLRLRIADEPGA